MTREIREIIRIDEENGSALLRMHSGSGTKCTASKWQVHTMASSHHFH